MPQYDEEDILDELTPALRHEVSRLKSSQIMQKVPFLRDQAAETLCKSFAAAIDIQIFNQVSAQVLQCSSVIETGETN